MASGGSKKFREYAASEASAAINKALSTRLTKSVGDLQAFRKSLDEAARVLEKALGAATDQDGTIAELVEKMSAAAAAETQEQVQRIKAEADAIIATAKAELGKAVEATNEARGQAARARDAHAKAEVARKELDAALQRTTKEKEAVAAEVREAKALTDNLHAKQKAAEEQRVQLANQLKQAAAKVESLERASADAANKAAHAESKAADAESMVADAERRAGEAERKAKDAERRASEAEGQVHETEKKIADGERRHAEAITKAKAEADSGGGKSGSTLELVLHSFQTLQSGNSTEDVMASLAKALTHDFSRVAVFRFANNRFSCTYEVGFGPKIDMSKATIPATTDSPLTRALNSNRAEAFGARALAESGCTMLAGTPQTVLTMPITVFDETLAVIYADDSDRKEKQNNGDQAASFAEVIRRFSVPLIEKRSIAPKLREELREYAALLLEELEYVHTSDVNAGKKEAEIRAHLKENLNGAREMYQQRVSSEPPAAVDLFDEKLRGIIDAKASSPFGNDLSAAAGMKPSAQPAKAKAR
jgi:hypothetical protein